MTDDSDMVSRSYLTLFFVDINNLKDALTGYRSIILRLGIDPKTEQNAAKILENVDDKMRNAVIQWSDSVRHNVERCQIAAEALSTTLPGLKTKDNKEGKEDPLKASYDKIIAHFAPDLEDVSAYTFEINKLFVKNTIDKLLTKMETFYDEFTGK